METPTEIEQIQDQNPMKRPELNLSPSRLAPVPEVIHRFFWKLFVFIFNGMVFGNTISKIPFFFPFIYFCIQIISQYHKYQLNCNNLLATLGRFSKNSYHLHPSHCMILRLVTGSWWKLWATSVSNRSAGWVHTRCSKLLTMLCWLLKKPPG